MKTIEYPLMATTMTRRQIDTIMQPILQAALRKCRIQNRLPRKLVYGTLRARGLGLKDPFITQLIQHLQAILRHANRDTPSQVLHQENMELVQLHIGSARNFWELPFEEYGCLAPKGWMKHTWECLDSTPLSLLGPPLQIPPLRQHDEFIMDAFVAQGYEDAELQILNDCRLYLKATLLSHICTA